MFMVVLMCIKNQGASSPVSLHRTGYFPWYWHTFGSKPFLWCFFQWYTVSQFWFCFSTKPVHTSKLHLSGVRCNMCGSLCLHNKADKKFHFVFFLKADFSFLFCCSLQMTQHRTAFNTDTINQSCWSLLNINAVANDSPGNSLSFSVVPSHVFSKMVAAHEFAVTRGTWKSLLSSMGAHVSRTLIGSCKGTAAVLPLTDKWLFT